MAAELVSQHGHMTAELVTQQHSQPAPDVCLIGSPPRQQQPPHKHAFREHEVNAAHAPVAELGTRPAQQLRDDSAAAELDFMQILEAAQHQRVGSAADTVWAYRL